MTLISCASSQLQIGSTLPSTAKKLNQGLLISAASIRDESYTLNEKGIEYIICLNAGKKIEYICTEDKKFVSPEGLKIGDTLKRALTATPDNLIIERGWAYYVKLPSGWNASFTQ